VQSSRVVEGKDPGRDRLVIELRKFYLDLLRVDERSSSSSESMKIECALEQLKECMMSLLFFSSSLQSTNMKYNKRLP